MSEFIGITVDLGQVEKLPAALERRLESALNYVVDQALEAVEQAQILSYTLDSNPERLRYERTFTLKSASRKRRPSKRLPTLVGEWYADEEIAPYAPDVIGARSEQAEVHRDRWKSLEQVAAEVEQKLPAILQEAIRAKFA